MDEEGPLIFNQEDKARFDFSFDTLNRINRALLFCGDASLSGNVVLWRHSLLLIYREIIPLFDEAKNSNDALVMKTINQKRTELNTQIRDAGELEEGEITTALYNALQELEIELRKALNHKKMYMRQGTDGFNMYGK